MRFEGQRPSGKDKDIMLYNFVFGQEELRAVREALVYFLNKCPKITETQIIRARMGTMLKRLNKFSVEKDIKMNPIKNEKN